MKRRSEKLLEKRRKMRERAQKQKEERKRAKEMKEEKWTSKNEHLLVAEQRKEQRVAHIDHIRKQCELMKDVIRVDQSEKEKRKNIIKSEIDEEIEDIESFIKETLAYYDEIHDQISPPEEKSVEKIVEDIERQMRQVFDVFKSCFEFEPKLPESSEESKEADLEKAIERDRTFTKDIAKLKEEIKKNQIISENLVKEICVVKDSIEMENVRFAAIKKEKAAEKMLKMRKIEKLQEKLRFISEDPVEYGEIIILENQVSEVSKKKKKLEEMKKQIEEILKKNQKGSNK